MIVAGFFIVYASAAIMDRVEQQMADNAQETLHDRIPWHPEKLSPHRGRNWRNPA